MRSSTPHNHAVGSHPHRSRATPVNSRHPAGRFNIPLAGKNTSWRSENLDGAYPCACGCRDELTTAAVVLHRVASDGTLGSRIGPCHPRHAPEAISRHGNEIAVVHIRYGKPGSDATRAAQQSNALLFQRADGPFRNLASPG